jgi:glycolate oxidase
VTLRLFAKPWASATLIVPYNNRLEAAKSALQIVQHGITPLAIEYVERELMEKSAKQIGEVWRVKEGYCYLLIVIAEHDENMLVYECAKIADICKQNDCLEPLYVDSKKEQNRILNIRSKIYSVLKAETADILDLVVPPANLVKLMDKIDEIAEKHSVRLPLYGHAADGNLHVHLTKLKEHKCTLENVEKLRNEIYAACLDSEGAITGEHGIGKVRTKTLHKFLSEKEIELMKNIKKIFDPNNILNPGTKIPPENNC